MAHYRAVGSIPHKRHVQHPRPEVDPLTGVGFYFEELMGEEGFSSQSALLYHRSVPAAIADVASWDPGNYSLTVNQPLLPRHLRYHDLPFTASSDLLLGRRLLLANADVRLAYVVASATSPWYRNAIGDECIFIERGQARLESVFGTIECRTGDYVIVPRATTHRWVPVDGEVAAIVIEANSHISPPKRYLSKTGQFLEHSPFCERDLRAPQQPLLAEDIGQQPDARTEIYIKHRASGANDLGIGGSIHVTDSHPLDVVGWDGCLYPYAFNISDYEPLTGRVHQPPPTHQVFEAHNVIMCNFVPRKVDYHPLAIPVPYYHSNVDSDEVMFYIDGDYLARGGSGIRAGSSTLHPGGHPHGPQLEGIISSLGVTEFNELAVMVDTFAPLELGEGARATEDPSYRDSWSTPRND
ncbi:MAG: homogentisate 1,2-dioxygenase [Nostocoides sp.]